MDQLHIASFARNLFANLSETHQSALRPFVPSIEQNEVSKEFTDIARRYWQEAGVADRIELRLGPGVETLGKLIAEKQRFDLIFIDANKDDYDSYYEQSLVLAKPGALIAIDNTLFAGRVVGQNMEGLADWQIMFTEHVKKLNAKLHKDPRVTLSVIAVGDGITLCVKN